MAKLRSVYPNVMELVREERIKSTANNRTLTTNIRKKSKLDLFESFYDYITDEICPESEREVIEKIIERAEKGEVE